MIFGLTHVPTLENDEDNILQVPIAPEDLASPIMTHRNLDLLKSLVPKEPAHILEIGVCQYPTWASSTRTIIEAMNPKSVYVGRDIEDRRWILSHYPDKKVIYWHATNSDGKFQVPDLDMLFIDGDHRLSGVLVDWHYTETLVPGGVVVLHDLRHHPGVKALWDAIDPELFDKVEQFLIGPEDFGMGVAIKRRMSTRRQSV